jgi:hypothetical protein
MMPKPPTPKSIRDRFASLSTPARNQWVVRLLGDQDRPTGWPFEVAPSFTEDLAEARMMEDLILHAGPLAVRRYVRALMGECVFAEGVDQRTLKMDSARRFLVLHADAAVRSLAFILSMECSSDYN